MSREQWLNTFVKKIKKLGATDAVWKLADVNGPYPEATVTITLVSGQQRQYVVSTLAIETARSHKQLMETSIRQVVRMVEVP